MEQETNTQKPRVRLVGSDGSVFVVIATVRKALRDAGQRGRAKVFTQKAFSAGSYDEVLALCFDFVQID